MDIKGWGQLLFRYYFEKKTKERVILHISRQDLIDFVKDEDVEVYKGRCASSFDDDALFNDYVHKFWISQFGNKDIKDLEKKINQIIAQARKEEDYVLLLPVLALLIMPICENDERVLHGNAYYGHLLPFLSTYRLVDKTTSTNFLANIRLDEIWGLLNQWAKNNGLPFQSRGVLSDNGTKQYVRSLMRESLLSPSKLQRFCVLFDHAGLVPKISIEDKRLMSAFSTYYTSIGITFGKYEQLCSDEFRDYLLSSLRDEYDNWDGTTRVKERDRRTGKIRVEAGNTAYPLLLQMDYDTNSNFCSFSLRLFCPDIDDMDYMSFVTDNSNKSYPRVYIKSDGYANQPFQLEESELQELFARRRGMYAVHEELDNSLKARHVVTDYYLLKLYKNRYVATNTFIKGEFYFAVIRHDACDDFDAWLKNNAAVLITDSALGGTYSVYRIECAICELQDKNNLRFKTDIKCQPYNNLEVKTDSDEHITYLSKLLPAQFEITGLDVSKDRVYAVSVTEKHRYSSELQYDQQRHLWVLKVFTDFFQLQTAFQLFCNESPIPYGRTYQFVDFKLPSRFKELSLDKWGDLGEPPLSKGLELPDSVISKNLINWEMLNSQMKDADSCPYNPGRYLEKDYLLYAITTASFETSRNVITWQWIETIRNRLSEEFENGETRSANEKYVLSNALSDYFRMGYINYAYTDKGFCLTANRPSLVLLTPMFRRTTRPGLQGKKIVAVSCVEKEYKCLLTGGRTIELVRKIEKYQQPLGFRMEFLEEDDYLQPQTIFIHAPKRAVFRTLAEKCGLLYQDNIYANSLLESLPTVADYISYIIRQGRENDFFSVPSCIAIDYEKMALLYPKRRLNSRAIANYEVEKEGFNHENDVVTFFHHSSHYETTVMICDGRMYEIDKYWGHFVGMFQVGAKVLQYDSEQALISLPQQFRLPLLYARALTLLIGNTPESVFGSRTYYIGVNPFTFASSPETILSKLGQY